MKDPKVLIFDNAEKLAEEFTHHFISLMNLSAGDFHVALSGGSTPKIWFKNLIKNHKEGIDWSRIHFYWGDERCVKPNDDDSNYGMTKKYLLDHINIPKENIHRIFGELIPDEAVDLFEKELYNILIQGDEVPVFDLIILGMGADGHTASIFPDQIELWDSDQFCLVAKHPETGQQRISLTGKVINKSRSIAFLVTGKNKADKIMEILYNRKGLDNYPAGRVAPENNNLYWFLDKAAASRIQI